MLKVRVLPPSVMVSKNNNKPFFYKILTTKAFLFYYRASLKPYWAFSRGTRVNQPALDKTYLETRVKTTFFTKNCFGVNKATFKLKKTKFITEWIKLELRSFSQDFKLLNIPGIGSLKKGSGKFSFQNLGNYVKKWENLTTLLTLIFFYNLSLALFTNKFLKKESVFLNWELTRQNFQFFKKSQPNYFLQNSFYGSKNLNLFKQVLAKSLNAIVITDPSSQKKTLYYARVSGLFTVALVSANYDPWLFSYPVLIISNSFFVQKCFLRMIFLIKKSSLKNTFEQKMS